MFIILEMFFATRAVLKIGEYHSDSWGSFSHVTRLAQKQFDNKKLGSPNSFLSHKRLKLKLRVLLAGHIVAMITHCATNLTVTCSPMTGQFFDTMILASNDKEWL